MEYEMWRYVRASTLGCRSVVHFSINYLCQKGQRCILNIHNVTYPAPGATRHTRTGGGSGPVGPRGLLSVRRRRVPSAESELLRAVSAPAS